MPDIGIAKEPPQKQDKTIEKEQKEYKQAVALTKQEDTGVDLDVAIRTLKGVYVRLFDYFDISPSLVKDEQLDKLKEVHSWIFKKGKTPKQALKVLQELSLRFGGGLSAEERLNTIYNYIKIRRMKNG